MSLTDLRRLAAHRFGDLTAISMLDRLIASGLICAGLWALIGVTVLAS